MIRINEPRAISTVLLIAALLIGFAQAALLPPWEGFDETAHYSYIQQLAETGRWPRFGDPVSADADEYLKVAPTTALLRPAWTYLGFFTAPSDAIAAARAAVHDAPARPRIWRPGQTPNWQAQHPPLYYLAMAPAYLMTKSWSLASQLLVMRGMSYLIALAGLCVAAAVAARELNTRPAGGALLLGIALWPFLFPMWFPEMARLGNDSLLVLLAACAWPLARRLIASEGSAYQYAALGALLGAGLLTKATFLPFAAVTIALLALRIIQARGAGWRCARQFMLLLGVTILVSGWWYLQKYFETGSAIGSNDVAQLQGQGGMAAGLAQHASLYALAKIPWILGISFLWGGTWSFVLPPLITILPLAAAAALLAGGYIQFVRMNRLAMADHLPLLALAAMLAALAYHSLVLIGAGHTGASGWYLHALAPVLAAIVGFGLAGGMSVRITRTVLPVLLVYPLVFLPIAMAVEAMVFAGCGAPGPGEAYFPLTAIPRCAARFDVLTGNLNVLGFPRLSAALFVCGWGVALIGVLAGVRWLRREILPQGQTRTAAPRPDR